jgi:hypothetical protein
MGMPASLRWADKSKTPPEAFRHVRRGVDQIHYYYNEIIGSVHAEVKRKINNCDLWTPQVQNAHSLPFRQGVRLWGP